MTAFMRLREGVRKFFSKHAIWLEKLIRGLVWFVSALVIDSIVGYAEALNTVPVAAGMAVLLAFAPWSVGAFIFMLFILMQLLSVSTATAVTGLLIFVFCYLVCGLYRSRHVEFFILEPVSYSLKIPFAVPMFSGLFGSGRDAGCVLTSCITAWFLKTVTENYALLTDKSQAVSPLNLLLREMVMNPLFYCFLAASAVMFLVCLIIRSQSFAYAWQLGALSGTVAEFVIMLAGDLFFDRRSQIPTLIISNVIVLAAGLFVTLVLRDFDFSRTEKIRFEDEEYYYYVTAVPKIRLASEVNEVKKITDAGESLPARDREAEGGAGKGAPD